MRINLEADRFARAPSVLAGGLTTPVAGPSDHTKDELKALKAFTDYKSTSLPHLVAWKTSVQGPDGPMPGGYVAYIVMTLMPGHHLMDLKFWSMTDDEREEIRRAFVPVLKYAVAWKRGTSAFILENGRADDDIDMFGVSDLNHTTLPCETYYGILRRGNCEHICCGA
jgi:hypothetical protein